MPFIAGILLLGGETQDSNVELKTEEIFPSLGCLQNLCEIPDLPEERVGHTLSVLSPGKFVVCGGYGEVDGEVDTATTTGTTATTTTGTTGTTTTGTNGTT